MALSIQERLLRSKNPAVTLAHMADKMARLERELSAMRPMLDEYKEIKAALVAFADAKYDADDDVTIETDLIEIELSQKDMVREISDMPALFNFIGKKKFLEVARFPIAALDQWVPKSEQKKFVRRTRTGARTFKTKLLSKKGKR